MKKITLIILIILATVNLNAQKSIMTYNIRYNTPNDAENWWEHRKNEVADMINYYQPDILGIQEGLNGQLKYLDSTLTDYSFVGVGRDDGKKKGEFTAIFYDRNTYQLLEAKTYWLSDSPEIVSVGWDASMERISTYGAFVKRDTGDTLHIFNAHYDHIGEIARKKSSELILSIMKEKGIAEKHLVLMGDLNAEPGSDPINILTQFLNDSYTSKAPYGPIGTFNGFKLDHPLSNRIDYIMTKNLETISFRHIDDRRKNKLWPSDHLPVLVELKFNKQIND